MSLASYERWRGIHPSVSRATVQDRCSTRYHTTATVEGEREIRRSPYCARASSRSFVVNATPVESGPVHGLSPDCTRGCSGTGGPTMSDANDAATLVDGGAVESRAVEANA